MDFLYRERGAGKRTVKPSKDSEHLEALLGEESDDSDFEVEKHKEGGSEGDDSDEGSENSAQNSSADGSNSSEEEEDDLLSLRKNLSTQELLDLASRQRSAQQPGPRDSGAIRVCGACLGSKSDDTDEIVICDSCGISVHEVCYGIQESGSVSSNLSDASTEPWFCEPCRANVRDPTCQVCPNIGGIYKETDVGSWIHLVCALYTPNISFFDPIRITRATLFELNYQNWGRRACTLCREDKLARTGICIECDAGMCKSFFHVSCAQEHGLLSEPKEDDHESYFGHCRLHSDKETVRRRRRSWLTNLLQYRDQAARIQADFKVAEASGPETGKAESSVMRIIRKLRYQRDRWSATKQLPAWIPTQKMPRSLLTSSSAVRSLLRKIDLQGWDGAAMEEAERNREILADINKRWNVNPAWSVEYVAYYHDRNSRIISMQESLASCVLTNNELSDTQTVMREQYSKLLQEKEEEDRLNAELKLKMSNYHQLLNRLDPLKRTVPDLNSARKGEKSTPGGRRGSGGTRKQNKTPSKPSPALRSPLGVCLSPPGVCLDLPSCRLCARNSDQHLLAHCDVCRFDYHLGCLNPPLERMPKKTKQYGWQCSECDKDPSEPFQYDQKTLDIEAPRSYRKRRSNFMSNHDSDFEMFSPPPPPVYSPPPNPGDPPTRSPRKRRSTEQLEREVLNKKASVCLPRIRKQEWSDASGEAGAEPDLPLSRSTSASRPNPLARTKSTRAETSKPARPAAAARADTTSTPGAEAPHPETETTKRKRSSQRYEPLPQDTNISIKVSEPTDSVLDSVKEPVFNGLISPKLPPKKFFKSKATLKEIPEEEEKTNFKDWLGKKLSPVKGNSSLSNGIKYLSDEVSSDVNAEINPNTITVRLEGSPANTPVSEHSWKGGEDSSAKKERRRQKKEEKEKRREEKRKLKAMMTVNIVSDDPDIEENDDTCVVRIAPKPIKIKIKPLIPPPDTPPPNLTFPHMHPKKKMVHMDSLTKNLHVHNGRDTAEPTVNSFSNPYSSESSVDQSLTRTQGNDLEIDQSESSNLIDSDRPDTRVVNLSAESTPSPSAGSDPSVLGASSPPLTNGDRRERRTRTPAAGGKKGRDSRTKCDVCLGDGNNSNLVRCDECTKCYHFTCLNPPVKKTPKVPGWAWSCSECAPSDEDKSWHL